MISPMMKSWGWAEAEVVSSAPAAEVRWRRSPSRALCPPRCSPCRPLLLSTRARLWTKPAKLAILQVPPRVNVYLGLIITFIRIKMHGKFFEKSPQKCPPWCPRVMRHSPSKYFGFCGVLLFVVFSGVFTYFLMKFFFGICLLLIYLFFD